MEKAKISFLGLSFFFEQDDFLLFQTLNLSHHTHDSAPTFDGLSHNTTLAL